MECPVVGSPGPAPQKNLGRAIVVALDDGGHVLVSGPATKNLGGVVALGDGGQSVGPRSCATKN
ncbi:hypothetical protein TNCV_285061, partial [Trichonephila clavipes]